MDGAGPTLQAPFPYFGGKSRVAHIVWRAFGDVPNYVEPFFGSGAVLLGRPHGPKIETVNDADGFLANFWRAIKCAPEEVAEHADWPVNENDLHARHIWLVNQREELTSRLEGDPHYYDAKIAGWWVWGICCWIGSGWCSGNGPWQSVDGQMVKIDGGGRGVNRKLVHLGGGRGVNRKRVHLGNSGVGVHRNLVHLGELFDALADRLRNVRVCCGDWARVMGPTPTEINGITGLFLDPPYGETASRDMGCYSVDSGTVAGDVLKWCIKNGSNPMLRIALCGYEGEHDVLTERGWSVHAWKTQGGYGNQSYDGSGRDNAHRERIWFSPACLPIQPKQGKLL